MNCKGAPRLKIDPFRLERWLLEKAEIDLGGGGVAKLQLREVIPSDAPRYRDEVWGDVWLRRLEGTGR